MREPFVNALGMSFVRVPRGSFWLGGYNGCCGTEPATIERDFELGVHHVTQFDWLTVMGSNPSAFRPGGPNAEALAGLDEAEVLQFPVENVSWFECQAFVETLNARLDEPTGRYRLPTAMEWEYACRGAPTTREECGSSFYLDHVSDKLLPHEANFGDSELRRPCRIGSYAPNRLGLHDMHGNVAEWCEDLVPDACGFESEGTEREIRGGCWCCVEPLCRAHFKNWVPPALKNFYTGLRLTRSAL